MAELKTILKQQGMTVHPAADMFPMLDDVEMAELVRDIKARGLLEPITANGKVIWDGRNRLVACKRAKAEPVFKEPRIGLNAYDYIISKNIHRRHLTLKQKRELIGKLLKAKPEASNREIAKQTKVHHETVGAVRAEMESSGGIRHIKHPKARKTANPKKITASPEISAEQRRADNAALDAALPDDWRIPEAASAFEMFKTECDLLLPKMTPEEIEAACDYLLEALDRLRADKPANCKTEKTKRPAL
jgi:ParB-like chromosome segregation protein Spo0J